MPVSRDLFEKWIKYVFDHPVTNPEWHWGIDTEEWSGTNAADAAPATIVALLTETFERSGEVLLPYSNAQVNQGLYYLASPSCSNFGSDIVDESIAWPDQRRCLQSIFTLYERCFAERCSPHLSHLDERGADPLNAVCYMWWDILVVYGKPDDPTRAAFDAECLSVMKRTLYLDSDACRESALHGLGHWRTYYVQPKSIIDEFLAHGPRIRPELKAYALNARIGHVQ